MTSTIPKYIFDNMATGWTTGPDKDVLPTATKLGMLSAEFLSNIGHDFCFYGNRNDIGNDTIYPLSEKTVLDGYRQVLLQHHNNNGLNEMDYTHDDPLSQSVKYLRLNYPQLKFCRSRLMVLYPTHSVPWHVDGNTTNYLRIHFIAGGNCEWKFRRSRQIYSISMNTGDIWFTNTGWLHTITNTDDRPRIMLTIHAEYKSVVETFGEFIEHAV
jgi:hypothetical protein